MNMVFGKTRSLRLLVSILNPRRRIRQHNGEIGCGAWRTKKKRPWEMVLYIYGFPTNVAALQVEYSYSTLLLH
ncbi:hypothetical protein PIB30_096177 [Stylosanthes scabra]|uniref:GIY-YIG domain-containing protein n=1 Tax=Stylosanthes scabra TaxID=79078 RepID=A0ABU6XW69_9FABA|nr:hypothetical protein [Stylosanthes scabra]